MHIPRGSTVNGDITYVSVNGKAPTVVPFEGLDPDLQILLKIT